MKLIQSLLIPLSFLYQGVLRLRNLLYDKGILGITEFDLPSINVGNLAFGGTGKTPHIEYLIRLLKPSYKLAVLSRGYKRKTIGYQFGNPKSTANTLGDEPYQIFTKFPDIAVAVAENRVLGIPDLLYDAPETELILLDDAYQHRALKPGLNILLTEQSRLYCDDQLFPSGYLREYRAASDRADLIVVSKCDPGLSLKQRESIKDRLQPKPGQKVFFSFIQYGNPVPYFPQNIQLAPKAVLAFAGIANPQYLHNYLQTQYEQVVFKSFSDHHNFTETEIRKLLDEFDNLSEPNKILLSTEKDFQKLLQSPYAELLHPYPLYYLPIQIDFFTEDKAAFHQSILDYVQKNRRDS